MRQSTKLVLDIVMGAVIPILILNRLTDPLGAPTAYVLAALVPVAWVLADLLLITRTFNFITSVAGLAAIANGVLAFWFVDGILFAFKDSISEFLFAAILGGSVLVGRPVLAYIFAQAIGADTPEKRGSLSELFKEPSVSRALVIATVVVTIESFVVAVINFYLNLNIVVADFGTGQFNGQVARVNAITRVSFPILSVATFFVAFWLVYRAVFRRLPTEDPAPAGDEFWRLVFEREARQDAPEN